MNTPNNISRLQNLSASQWGLFTTAQAQQAGVGRTQISRMQTDGRIENLLTGVYRFTSGEETSFVNIKAQWLAAFPKETAYERVAKQEADAVVTGRTAAHMHGFGDLYESPYHFIVRQRKQTRNENLKYLLWDIEERDIEIVDGLPVAKVERTIADLIRAKEDPSLIDDVVRDACRAKRIDAERLSELLAPLAARNGYSRNAGDEFANDLIRRNSDPADILSSALEPLMKMYATMDAVQEPLRNISKMILGSSSISPEDLSALPMPKITLPKTNASKQLASKISDSLSPAFTLLADAASKNAEGKDFHEV